MHIVFLLFFNFFYPEICLYLAAGLSFFTACHVGKAFLMRLISIQPKCGVCCAWRLGLSGVRASIPALVQLYHPAGTISGITLLPGSFRVAFSTKWLGDGADRIMDSSRFACTAWCRRAPDGSGTKAYRIIIRKYTLGIFLYLILWEDFLSGVHKFLRRTLGVRCWDLCTADS